jgi:RHS repeat-associated protein
VYSANDIVEFKGQLYRALSSTPPSAPNWDPIQAPSIWQPFEPAKSCGGQSQDATRVVPFVDCVEPTGNGRYVAVFGYENGSSDTVLVPQGDANRLSGSYDSAGRPVSFAAGTHHAALTVNFDGQSLRWTIGGKSASASQASSRCPLAPNPDGSKLNLAGDRGITLELDRGMIDRAILGTEPATPTGTEAVGTLPGNVGVSADGAATYALDIWAPPLPAELSSVEPHLSLVYNSRSARSNEGVGWNLAGPAISRIQRCPGNFSQDLAALPVNFNDWDAFCLDGQRLLPNGAPKATGEREYTLERDRFVRVRYEGNGGPFHVYNRDGRVSDYGSTVSSRHTAARHGWGFDLAHPETPVPTLPDAPVTYAWAIDRIRDPQGNSLEVNYEQLDGRANRPCTELIPTEIRYGLAPNQTTPASRRLVLSYEGNQQPMPSCQYLSGFGIATTRVLERIDAYGPTKEGTALLRTYHLDYQYRSQVTNRPLLHSVKACDGAGICMPPTSFTWDEGDSHFEDIDTKLKAFPGGITPADLNGDGKDDLLFLDDEKRWRYVTSDGKKFGSLAHYISDGPAGHFTTNKLPPIPVDFDMDQKSAFVRHEGQTVHLYRFDSSTDAMSEVEWGQNSVRSDAPQVYIGDLNGDGAPDVLKAVDFENEPTGKWAFRFNQPRFGLTGYQIINQDGRNLLTTDTSFSYMASLDGTGKASLLMRYGDANTDLAPNYTAVALTNLGYPEVTNTTLLADNKRDVYSFHWLFADVNADGNTDALKVPNGGGIPELAFNTGQGFEKVRPIPGVQGASQLQRFPNTIGDALVGDWNGDGLADVILTGPRSYDPTVNTNIVAYTADPSLDLHPVDLHDEAEKNEGQPHLLLWGNSAVLLDVDGNGLSDIALLIGNRLHLYRHVGNKPDVITGFQNGLGAQTTVKYSPIGDSKVYTPSNECQYPQHCMRKGMWVVSQIVQPSDWTIDGKPAPGAEPVNSYRYTYSDGRADLRGRGWLGFRSRTILNEQTLATSTTLQDNASPDIGVGYPRAGVPEREVTTVPVVRNGAVVSRVTTRTTSYNVLSQPGRRGAEILPTNVEETVEESAVSANGVETSVVLSHTTTTLGYDLYNNLNSKRVIFSNGEERAWSAQFDHNTSKQILALLRRTDETSAIPGQPSVTRTHVYTPNPDTGLLRDETIEPDGGPSLRQFRKYDRTARGLIRHVVTTASEQEKSVTRESWVAYDAEEGLFPTSATNSLGQRVQSLYHRGLGLPVYAEDPNGVASRTYYDRFGRIRRQEADGVGPVTVSYGKGNPWPTHPTIVTPGLFSVVTDQTGGGRTIATYNQLGHEVLRATRTSGGWSHTLTEYSQIPGQVSRVSRPFGAETPPHWIEYHYDELGRPTSQSLPDGGKFSFSYFGRATTTVNPKGFARTDVHDELGRLIRVDEDTSVPEAPPGVVVLPPRSSTAVTTTYTHGPFGVLNEVSVLPRGTSQPTKLSSMKYDKLGRRVSVLDADNGETVDSHNGFGELDWEVDANRQMHVFTRDPVGRVVVDMSTQDGSTCTVWDGSKNGVGKLASTTSPDNVTTSYRYDRNGRIAKSRWNIQGRDFDVDWATDDLGHLTKLTYPKVGDEQLAVTFGFDGNGRVSSLSSPDPRTPVSWNASVWEIDGRISREHFGSDEETVRFFEPIMGRLTDISTRSAGSAATQDLHYKYDINGNVETREDKLLGTKEQFEHDWLDRLQVWRFSSEQGSWETTYKYSDLGNIDSRISTGPGATNHTYKYGARDAAGAQGSAGVHAATSMDGEARRYDPKGNQISAPGRKVSYTSFGLPKQLTRGSFVTRFSYAASHERALKRSSDGSTTTYLGKLYEKRVAADGHVSHVFFVPAGDRIVAQITWKMSGSGNSVAERHVAYLHDDHLRSIEAVTEGSGAERTIAHLKYGPFGDRINPTNPMKSGAAKLDVRAGFTEHEHDDEAGLINMRGRIYDPKLGRFLSGDPLVPTPSSSQAYNRYTYVLNSPLGLVDPRGFAFQGNRWDYTCQEHDPALCPIDIGVAEEVVVQGRYPDLNGGDEAKAPSSMNDDTGIGIMDVLHPGGAGAPNIGGAQGAPGDYSMYAESSRPDYSPLGGAAKETWNLGVGAVQLYVSFMGMMSPEAWDRAAQDRAELEKYKAELNGSEALGAIVPFLIVPEGEVAEGLEAAEGIGVAEEIGILQSAAKGSGNFGVGVADAATAERLGQAWVGEGATVASDGTTLVSADGLRQFRPPSWKPNLGRIQANFEQRFGPSGPWNSNGHLDILYGPEPPP